MQPSALTSLPQNTAKNAVLHRVENDIASLNRKISRLEQDPLGNDQLLSVYRLMLQSRTEVLRCLLETLHRDMH
jgi:hypothetical protein